MRNLSIPNLGYESEITVEVDWSGSPITYDPLSVGSIDAVGDTAQVSVVLSDTKGEIRAILKSHDAHERPARILQNGTVLFAGKLVSPIRWSEGAQTVSFDILSALDDGEFGFSAEEGEFPLVPRELVGKAWPVVFGTVLDYPALQITKAVTGSTLSGLGILSGKDLQMSVPLGETNCSQGMALALMAEMASLYSIAASRWASVDVERAAAFRDQANEILAQMTRGVDSQATQLSCGNAQRQRVLDDAETKLGGDEVRVLGGEDFPQDTPIELNINGGLFTGKMHGDSFTILSRRHPDNDERAQSAFDNISTCATATPTQFFDMQVDAPGGAIRRHGFIVCDTPSASRPSLNQVAQHFWAEPGSRVVMSSDEPMSYIASITPGEVLAVKAYKTLNGERKLVNVPNDLWSASVKDYGEVSATIVTTVKPLSSIPDQHWSDELYITFRSDIGPNTVDIIEWGLGYTDLVADPTSFAYVRGKLEPFPMNFPVLDRRNTLDLLKDIAYQARCALWVNNGVVHLKYLPEEPESDQTITLDDIAPASLEVGLVPDVYTKFVMEWRLNWADEPSKVIIRSNNDRYGLREKSFDFFTFNNPDIALKVATFWAYRQSNSWKKVRLRGFLNLINLEPYDTVTLDLPGLAASGAVKAVVESVQYDSESYTIDVELLVPVKAGSMVQDRWFWPAATDGEFQTSVTSTGVTGELPIGYLDANGTSTVWVGGPNVVFRQRSDRGDRRLADTGFVVQPILPTNVFADVVAVANPNPNLRINYLSPTKPIPVPPLMSGDLVLDIRKTKVIDSSKPSNNASARLDSFFREVNRDGELVMADRVKASDGVNSGEFVVEHDPETGEYGVKTAYFDE